MVVYLVLFFHQAHSPTFQIQAALTLFPEKEGRNEKKPTHQVTYLKLPSFLPFFSDRAYKYQEYATNQTTLKPTNPTKDNKMNDRTEHDGHDHICTLCDLRVPAGGMRGHCQGHDCSECHRRHYKCILHDGSTIPYDSGDFLLRSTISGMSMIQEGCSSEQADQEDDQEDDQDQK